MKKMFAYKKFQDDSHNQLVESFVSLAHARIEGKANTPEYKAANKEFNAQFMLDCFLADPSHTKDQFNLEESMKNPMVYDNVFFKQRFNTILAQMITPVVPEVIAAGYEDLYDVMQVGFGDNAKYRVESNEMFIVNDAAVGVRRGGVKTTWDAEYTVAAHKKEVSAYIDWYVVAAGRQDWGKFGVKVGRAYAAYVQGKVVKALESIVNVESGEAAKQGIAGYIANGMSDANWLATSRNVELANGGATVYALGTRIALGDVLPAEGEKFQYNEDSAIVKKGYLPVYKEVPLMELGNALVPNTVNGVPKTICSDKIIYMLPMGMNKPVKVVTEGNTLAVSQDPSAHADHTYTMTIDMWLGVDTIVGSKFGAIVLA